MNKSEIKKELIDFIKWFNNEDNPFTTPITETVIDNYILSINSDAQVESRSVGDNEQTKKTCILRCVCGGLMEETDCGLICTICG